MLADGRALFFGLLFFKFIQKFVSFAIFLFLFYGKKNNPMKIQDPSRFSRINNSFDEYVTLFAGNLANFRRDNKFEKYSENFTGTRMHYIHSLQSNVRTRLSSNVNYIQQNCIRRDIFA